MTLRSSLIAALSVVFLTLMTPRTASADITAFIGATTTPLSRPAKGFAVGAGLLIVGFEFEYATTSQDVPSVCPVAGCLSDLSLVGPHLDTYMFNGLLQTPVAIAGIQPYATLGGGAYREFVDTPLPYVREISFGTNVGGGAKISLMGPVRLRVDYRVFNLHGLALHPIVQRFYAGINLKF